MKQLHDDEWLGEPCYLVGGGPSLKNFDWKRLAGKKVVAINCAYQVLPEAPVVFSRDKRWMDTFSRQDDYRQHRGLKVYQRLEPGSYGMVHMHVGESREWGFHFHEGLVWARNTGLAALHLADILGATPIYLLGFDMKGENGQSKNWHNQYRSTWTHGDERYKVYIEEFVRWRPYWRGRVYNCCVNGGLAPYLRTKDVDEVLP